MNEEVPIRVLLVDLDHGITERIVNELSAEPSVQVVALASNEDFGLHQALSHRPAVVITAKSARACNLMYELRLLLTARFAPRAIFVAAPGTSHIPSSCVCGIGCSVLAADDLDATLLNEICRLSTPASGHSQHPAAMPLHAGAMGWVGAASN